MDIRSTAACFIVGIAGFAILGGPVGAAEDAAPAKIKAVILVGGHGYDKRGFEKLWASYDDISSEVWQGDPYTAFDDLAKLNCEVIVFYNLSSGINETQRQNFLKLLDRGVGVVVWHHALGNCQDWSEFEKIAGARFWMKHGERNGTKVRGSGTGFGTLKMHVEDANHPITKGVSDFEIDDETYNHQTFSEGIHVLLSTDHAKSDKPIAWVNTYAKSRVFGYQSGHDARVWTNEGFRQVFGQGIRWAAGRLPAENRP